MNILSPKGNLDDLWDYLVVRQEKIQGKLLKDADLSKITWFRTGGHAQIFFQPESEEDLAHFLALLPEEVPVTMVGIGSNLLVRDGGVEGVVIRLGGKNFSTLNWLDTTSFEAGCGISDKKIAMAALEQSVGGFHFYYGIPGNLGGALKMNAGANGCETSEYVITVRMMDRKGKIHQFSNTELGYTYRHSSVDNHLIFLSAIMRGYESTQENIKKEMQIVQHHREEVQPIREKTGGSTFRNPATISAWKAIDEAGCRGLTFGNAQMSPMHCNFMINKGGASAYELELLGEKVRQKVYEHSKILLKWEIARIGKFSPEQKVMAFYP